MFSYVIDGRKSFRLSNSSQVFGDKSCGSIIVAFSGQAEWREYSDYTNCY